MDSNDEILQIIEETEALAERTLQRRLQGPEIALVYFAALSASNKARAKHIQDLEMAVKQTEEYAKLRSEYNTIIEALLGKKDLDHECPLAGNPHIDPCPVCP